MKKYEIIFSLNETEKIVTHYDESLKEFTCCYETPIVFDQNNCKIQLSNDDLLGDMETLAYLLKKALLNKIQLHKSIPDIGYQYNEYCDFLFNENSQVKRKFAYKKLENSNTWTGNSYELWAYDVISWIYNNLNGQIIFEITPIYADDFSEPKEKESLQEWLTHYKPVMTRIIPKHVAQQWLVQAQEIIERIYANNTRLQQELDSK